MVFLKIFQLYTVQSKYLPMHIQYFDIPAILFKMHRNFFNADHQDYIPTIQSIDAQSQFSVDLKPHDLDPLLTKIFMLCLELDRKDLLIDQLRQDAERGNLRKSQIDITHRDLTQRYEKLEYEYRGMIQNNALLKNEILTLQKYSRELEVYKNNATFNQQMQERIHSLESKLRRTEEDNIELVEKEKNLKRELSMLSYNVIKTSEKNRIRDLEHELLQEKSRVESQKRVTTQQKFMLEKYHYQIQSLKESEKRIVKTYEEKISLMKTNQDLKKSQISMASDEKLMLITQETNRLKQEVDHLRRQLHEQKNHVKERDEEIFKLNEDIKCLEKELQNFQTNYSSQQHQFQQKEQHLLIQLDKFEKENKGLHNSCREMDFHLKQKSNDEGEKDLQIRRLKDQLEALESEKTSLRGQLRKVKRQSLKVSGECQICRVRGSSTSIQSGKKLSQLMNPIDFTQLINQAEKLRQSNKKMDSWMSQHQISSQQSIENKHSFTHVLHQSQATQFSKF